MQIRKKLRSLQGLLQFRGNEQEISHTAHKLSVGAFALQSALDKVGLYFLAFVTVVAASGNSFTEIGVLHNPVYLELKVHRKLHSPIPWGVALEEFPLLEVSAKFSEVARMCTNDGKVQQSLYMLLWHSQQHLLNHNPLLICFPVIQSVAAQRLQLQLGSCLLRNWLTCLWVSAAAE